MAVTGARGRCPACRAALAAPATELVGERRCPRCSADLWVVAFSDGRVFFPRRPVESLDDLLVALVGPALGRASELEAAMRETYHIDLV
jgi:hypothetical protein